MQHNCVDSNCTKFLSKARKQERIESDLRTFQFVEHTDTPLYLLNTHSIHNYQHIHSALPETLREVPTIVVESERRRIQLQAVKAMQAQRNAAKEIPPFPDSAHALQAEHPLPSKSTHVMQPVTEPSYGTLVPQDRTATVFPFDRTSYNSAVGGKKRKAAPSNGRKASKTQRVHTPVSF